MLVVAQRFLRCKRKGTKSKVVSIQSSEEATEVITLSRRKGHGNHTWRSRYQLVPTEESWQIARIETECSICEGTGKFKESDCEVCNGKGWSSLIPE